MLPKIATLGVHSQDAAGAACMQSLGDRVQSYCTQRTEKGQEEK